MKIYRVKDWDIHFENNKSREREQCSFVCVPNKQHGMGFSRVMAESDGATIYGIWSLILGACSQQKRTEEGGRCGWLTHNGLETGKAWSPEDLALKFRRAEAEVARAVQILTSENVDWLETYEVSGNQVVLTKCPSGARRVPAECPSGAPEEKRREEKEMKEENLRVFRSRLGKWFNRREGTALSPKEEKAIKTVFALETTGADLALLETYYSADIPKAQDFRRRDLVTLLNNWNGEIDRAKRFSGSTAPDYSNESNLFNVEE